MSERAARAQIAAAMSLLVVLAAFSEGWVDGAIARIRSLTQGGGRALADTPGGRGESGFGPGGGAGQGAGGGGGGSF